MVRPFQNVHHKFRFSCHLDFLDPTPEVPILTSVNFIVHGHKLGEMPLFPQGNSLSKPHPLHTKHKAKSSMPKHLSYMLESHFALILVPNSFG